MTAVVLVVAHVSKLLPNYGIAWMPESGILNISSVLDDKRSSLLTRFIQQLSIGELLVCSSFKSLRTEVSAIVQGLGIPKIDFKPATLPVPITESSSASDYSSRYLPALATEARARFAAFFPERYSAASVCFSPCITPGVTSVIPNTLQALNVWEDDTRGGGRSGKEMLLSKYLGRTLTAMGKRRFPAWLQHPLTDSGMIGMRQSVIIGSMGDIDLFMYQLANGLRMSEIAQRAFVNGLPDLVDTIDACSSLSAALSPLGQDDERFDKTIAQPLIKAGAALQKLKDLIFHVFNVDGIRNRNQSPCGIVLNPGLVDIVRLACDEVQQCQAEIEAHRCHVESRLNSRGGKGLKLKLVVSPSLGQVFRVPKSIDIPEKYEMVRVNKAETQFTSSELKSLNSRLDTTYTQIKSTEAAFIRKVISVGLTYTAPLSEVADLVGMLDIMLGMATAISLVLRGDSWCMPAICDIEKQTVLEIDRGRHPLLDFQHSVNNIGQAVVPNSLAMSSEANLVLVTGPNMGGKSTFSRQAALVAYLSQIGCPVPCDGARLTPFSLIWTRIGAEDNPTHGASTFMTEAVETALLLNTLANLPTDKHALVIVDELGRGTSASDGVAFAHGVLKKLSSAKNALTIFATHFHELATSGLPNSQPLCMERDSQSRFKVRPGVESDSDAIVLAQSLGFPESVTEDALKFLQRVRCVK